MGLSKLRALYAKAESSFAVDPNADGSTYVSVPAEEISLGGDLREHIERPLQRSTLTQIAGVAGAKNKATLGFKLDIAGLATQEGGAVAQRAWLAPLFAACGLTETLGTGSTASSGCTTTSIPVASAAGIGIGTAIGWENAAGVVEAAFVTGKSGNTLTVEPAFSGSPAENDVIYASATYMQQTDPASLAASVALHMVGDGYRYTLLGCGGTVKLEGATAGSRPMLAFQFQVADWNTDAKASLPAATMPAAPLVVTGGRVHYGATLTPVRDLAFDPGFALSPKEGITTSGAQCRYGYALTDRKAAASFKVYQGSVYASNFAADTEAVLCAQMGLAAGKILALHAHRYQLTAFPLETDHGGQVGHDLAGACNASQVASLADWSLAFL